MALEVGRLVARIDIEGSFEQKIAAAKTAMEDAAKSAARFDDALGKAGESGKRLDVPAKAKDSLDKTAASASKASDNISKAGDAGKKLDVSDAPKKKLEEVATSAGKASSSMQKASDTGKKMNVSDQPRQKLAETASFADQLDAKLGHVGLSLAKLKTAGTGLAIGATLFAGLERVKAIDTAQGKLRGLGHEAASVTEIMTSATDAVTGTAYGLGDAATIAANAVAAGIKPGKDLTKYLTMTADASAIAGVSLGEMGRILNQVQTGQSAYAGDLSQLADRGIPIYQWLGDEAGVAASEIKKMASTGQVSSEMLFSAIQKNIGGAAQEMGGTLTGSLANVGAAFGRLGASAIDPFKDDIMAAAEGAQEFAGALAGVVGPAAGVAASALSGVAKVVGTIPTPILAATAGLVALQKTGLGASMAGAASTAVGALRGVGETMALGAMYAGDNIRANGLFAASMDGLRGSAGGLKKGLGSIVDMLGGPLMIGLAGAAIAVTAMVDSASRAKDANQALADAASEGAAAQTELGDALLRSNGLMDEQATAASEKLIDTIVEGTKKAAESATGAFNIVDGPMHRMRNNYGDLAEAAKKYGDTSNGHLAQAGMQRLEMQALGDALSATGYSMDDLNEIVAEGGPRWDRVRAALSDTGLAGEAMIGKLEGGQDAIRGIVESATEAEIASTLLADAFRIMADESSTAEEKTNALKAALDALAGETLTADQATGKFYETMDKLDGSIDKLSDGAGSFTRTLEDGGLAFDMTSEKGRGLHATLMDMRDATAEVRDTGGDLSPIMEANERKMQALAAETGLTTDEMWKLAERMGFIPEVIETLVAVDGAGAVAGELALVSNSLKDVEKGATVEVKNISDEALSYLQSVGWQAERIEGTTDIRVVASTAEANAGLRATTEAAARLDALDPSVNVDTNAEWVTHALGVTAEATEGLPPGHVEITDTTDTNLQRLANLGIEVSRDKNGRVLINDADVDRARGRVNDLNKLQTSSTHTVNVIERVRSYRPGGSNFIGPVAGGADGGIRESYANGGVGGLRPWLEGATAADASGRLPSAATIQRPVGTRGLVQWAESETEGEAFIPLAASKRQRSRKIWAETGRRLGIDIDGLGDIASFANGGVVEGMTGLVSKKFPALKATSTYRNSNDHHGAGKAADFSNGYDNTPEQLALANYIADNFPDSLELIYSHPGFNRNIKNGKFVGDGVGFYGAGTMAGHRNHVHWAMSTPPSEASEKAKVDTLGGAAVDNRTPRQKNIDAIVQEGQRRGLSDRDIQVALMTAEQESGIRVLANPADAASMNMPNEGVGYDHDSTGIFQQRNNGAWGTLQDRMDPTKSAGMFYDQLEKIEGRDSMALTQVAQKVQRSAYPDAYAKHEGKASEELAASKARLESLSKTGGGSGEGQKVFVTNWPSGGGSYTRSAPSSDAIDDAKDAVEDAQKAAFIQDQSIAAMLARSAGRPDLIQVEKFADGGFHGLENHSAHIAPQGSYRIFGESETGGEAYIPLASHKRARSTAVWMETGRRLGYGIGAGLNLVGSVLTGNGLDTGWGGPSLGDVGIDTGALREALGPGVTAEAARAGEQIAAILTDLGKSIDRNVDGTLKQVGDGQQNLRQQYARAMI